LTLQFYIATNTHLKAFLKGSEAFLKFTEIHQIQQKLQTLLFSQDQVEQIDSVFQKLNN